MGILDRAIKRGISQGIGKAVGNAVERAVAPKAAELANRTAAELDQAAANATGAYQESRQQYQAQTPTQTQSAYSGAFANLQRAAEDYATEVGKKTKVCPSCGEPASADKKFCPSCGTKLPEMTVAEGAVCTACGKQNTVGTKFCSDCGAKLPAALAEEQAESDARDAVLAKWDALVPQIPHWTGGGTNLSIEDYDSGNGTMMYQFFAHDVKRSSYEQYMQLLLQSGFRQAGRYPSQGELFKRVNGVCYGFLTQEVPSSNDGSAYLEAFFGVREPEGGFDYVKPEPKKSTSLFDLFK